MNAFSTSRRVTAQATVRAFLVCAAFFALLSCGGGGDSGGGGPTEKAEGVYSGFSAAGNLDWTLSTDGGGGTGDGGVGAGGGGGADGDGGVGAGGDFGQFRNALLIVKYPDGTPVGNGQALTDATTGMVTIVPRKGYLGPLYLELRGGSGATYYEEGKDSFVDFPAGQVIRAMVPEINKNIGITPFSEAAYRLLTEGSTAERAINPALPTAAEIAKANGKVRDIVNQQFPATLNVDDITRLPFIKSPTIGAGSIGIDARGRYGLINGAFSKQAAMFNQNRSQPTLDAVAQLGGDLLDGVLDGMNGNQPAVAAAARTYDPNTLTGELSSALAEQSYRFGTDVATGALPKVVNFANSRYQGYLFDASITAQGQAFDTVSGWVGDNAKGFSIGQSANKLPGEARVFGVFGNLGHGGLFFKTNTDNSQSKFFVVGDNVNGELGVGNSTSTNGLAVQITLPGVLTHVAGGFAHTVARMADGSVYAWGDNSFGQLGNGGTTASTTPLQVALPRGAIAVAATNTASYALLDDGSVYAWGSSGGFGLLGDGNKDSVSLTPTPITALNQVVQITARDNDVAVVRKDGSVLQWGSFPADQTAFTAGDLTTPYAGGTPLPTALVGLPAGVPIRKILTEQGLFAVLLADGSVYEWGVYFDITAQGILRDTVAQRVLNLPPVRDMMPGGFIGYGVRPFDRLTSMGIDYHGGMWKIRGRVAEEFDPANPTLQRRPLGQFPRPDCASCHTTLTDWPLTPEAPTTTDVCVPPTSIHGGGANGALLIHAETACEECHNPNRQPPAAMFPRGWLTCVKPSNLPPRSSPVAPDIINTACTIPVGHTFTPPGTVCATCHNSIIARPLNDPSLSCAQPQSSALPSINATATVLTALNDNSIAIPTNSATSDATPQFQGTISAPIQTGQSLRVRRNGTDIGAATMTGATTWTFTDPGAPNGPQAYTARIEAGPAFGPTSNSYLITIDTVAPTQTLTVLVSDDINPGTPLPNPGFTSDTTPAVSGTLSAPLAAGETVRVFRGGVSIANVVATGTSWAFTEPVALAGATYTYTARVVDAAGNIGPLSGGSTVTIVTSLPTVVISRAANDANTTIAAGGFTNDTTPTLQGTLSAGLSGGQLVRVLRDSAAIGTATVTTTTWTFNDPGASNGAHTYTARSEQGTVFSALSPGYAFTVDTVAPTQTANVTQISDDVSGNLADGASTSDTTPTVAGSLSAVLGANESLQVLRGGAVVATLSPAGTTWTFTEPSALAGATYIYSSRVVDAAGNVSAVVGTTRTVIVNTSFPLAAAATTLSTINGAVPSNGAVPLNNTNAPTLAGTIQRALATSPLEVVRIYRSGVAVGVATVSGTNWTFSSAALADGTYAFLARIEQSGNSGVFGAPSASVNDPIDATAPSQTVTITATSNVVPFSTVPGAIPASNAIVGLTNDPTPTVTVQLSGAMSGAESLVIRRNGTVISPSVSSCGANCFVFTDNSGVAISTPPTAPSALPVANTYSARVVDTAGNLGAQGGLTANFDYFTCNQVRADTTYGGTHSSIGLSTTRCSDCHANVSPPDPAAGGGTPSGSLVGVPKTNPTYWCRRP